MNTEVLTRRLSAILSADVEGYSRLMREDEEATVRTITTHRAAMTHMIEQYRGRVVDSPGDNILAEFTSVVDAVNCGVEIQRELAERNAELPENRRMRFRIGINLGDVLEEGDRIYGDGVNIAARMESLAEAGGICISGTVYDAIENKIGLEYEYLGEHEVKNIDKPIRAYKVLSFPGAAAHRVVKAKIAVGRTWRNALIAMAAVLILGAAAGVWHFHLRPPSMDPASVEKMAFPLPDKPSIAVLPFVNISKKSDHEYLCDGITEDIITALSKIPRLMVIARTSSYAYKEKPVTIARVSEDLGVQYVLEGSLRRSGDQIRITAQLIDAIKGHHIWAETYDHDVSNFFEVEEELILNILTALQVHLTEGDQARLWRKEAKNIKAYLKNQEALENFRKFTKGGTFRSRELAREAIEIDPDYVSAYRMLAWTYWMGARYRFDESPSDSIERAVSLTQKVLSMDEDDPLSYYLLAGIHLAQRKHDKSIEAIQKAHRLSPNNADILGYKALVFNY
ncbi:MAG: guanylyl cyclase, partial [Deltaproteobacteria bacterium]|nr:guanylyl cyclase [Deltaproteobacteria bacterium]